ncbi:cilia- and flagella-associated protein 43-like [Clytia hemisphaerica]|uniref:Cilia- and flagella-associated protein 43 n=1 Tax=Clytia hemisphaerica TaxID=252671 RepID=A0A7M5XLR9_9CNID
MDQFGDIVLNWSVGYDGSPVHFLDNKTICYVNGNCIKIVNIEDNSVNYLQSPGNGIAVLAVNPLYGYLAFSENGLNANIYIYNKNDLVKPSHTLPGFDNSLGYKCISFANNGTLLATCTDIPNLKLSLWNWQEAEEYCSYDLQNEKFDEIIFNPLDWHQLACVAEKTVLFWNVEKVNETFYLQKTKIGLPKKDGTFGFQFLEGDSGSSISSRPTTGHKNLTLTQTAIAGLTGEGKDKFLEVNDKDRCHATCFCWQPNNQLLIACTGGMLINYDCENQNVSIIHNKDSSNQLEFNKIQLRKDGLFASTFDGDIYQLTLSKDDFHVKSRVCTNQVVTNLKFSPNYETLMLSGTSGSILKLVGEELSPIIEDNCIGQIIGIRNVSAALKHIAVGRSEGLISIYEYADGKLIGKCNLESQLTCLACSPTSSTVFVGTACGCIVVIDVTEAESPRCVYQKKLHEGPVKFIKIDETGTIMMTSSTDGHLFFCNPTLSSQFNIFGYIDVNGEVVCMDIKALRDENSDQTTWKVLVGLSTSGHQPASNHLVEMTINENLMKGASSLFLDDTKKLKDISIQKKTFVLKSYIYDVIVVNNSTAFGLVHQGKRVVKYNLDDQDQSATPGTNAVLDASVTYPAHALPGGQIVLSCHSRWLMTSSPDGVFIMRAVGAMNNKVPVQAANYREGGIDFAQLSPDAQQILVVSRTGIVTSWKWNYTSLGKSKATVAIETCKSLLGEIRDVRNKEDSLIKKMKKIDLPSELGGEQETWLHQAVQKSRKKEDEKYKTTKNNLKNEINNLRKQVLDMMSTNDQLPDIEKLDRFEFNMDTEERNALLVGREQLLKELRAESELKDTAQQYLWSLLKKECWDGMVTKGKNIIGFHSTIQVENYAMRERTPEEIEELDYVTQQLRIEQIEKGSRKANQPPEVSSYPSLLERQEDTQDGDDDASDIKNETASTYGSLAYNYGVANDLVQSQFTLHTRNQKKSQIALLKDCVYKIKQDFNKSFNEVYNVKQQEMKRINERNTRIQKILKDLDLHEELIEVEISSLEEPELLFTVHDNEITVEKYVSEEEKQRFEEIAKLEEERRLAENADNLRGRALDMMMAGRLETGIEDELKKEVEVPEFMDKPLERWTEDEHKLAKEYEQKKIELSEEREKYRKSLETELKKLQTTNVDSTNNFDERLLLLFQKKIKTKAVILQEELKIVRLAASILIDEELENAEFELLANLDKKKEEKQQSSLAVGDARRAVEQFKDSYEMLVADDKTLDKMFRKEFSELDTHTIDVLYRLFKKRPRAQRTLKAAFENQNDIISTTPYDKGNPFQQRPSSSRAVSAAAANLERAMLELDNEQHMPENVDIETWKRLIMLRRTKVEKEQQLKSNALVMADLNSFLQKKLDRDEELKFQVEKAFEEIQRLREERLRFNLNLEVQLLLKQGQIEVGNCKYVPDYTDSVLIHRSAIEDLNAVIKTLGEAKLSSMHESKEFRKGIHLLAWQLKEMFMRAEDFQSAAQDLQLLRVTKELQGYLGETDQRQSKNQEITTLEKTIEKYSAMHNRKVSDKKRTIRRLKRQIREKMDQNHKFDDDLEDLALNVAERTQISKKTGGDEKQGVHDHAMKNIIMRRKFVDLAKTQASQIGVLRAEVERLRMRTFPALVQLDA